jgi:hypothetical protein
MIKLEKRRTQRKALEIVVQAAAEGFSNQTHFSCV